MKKKTLRYRSLLAMLSLLGFSGCDLFGEDMYGTPAPTGMQIRGRVCDPAGHPIPGIRVESRGDQPIATGNDGTYSIRGTIRGQQSELLFTDDDGPANGGDFASSRLTVTIDEATFDPASNDYVREDVEVVLHEKE